MVGSGELRDRVIEFPCGRDLPPSREERAPSPDLSALSAIGEAFETGTDFKEALRKSLERLIDRFRLSKAGVFLTDPAVLVHQIEIEYTADSLEPKLVMPIRKSGRAIGKIEVCGPELSTQLEERLWQVLGILATLISQAAQLHALLHPGASDRAHPEDGHSFHPKNIVGNSKTLATVYEAIWQVTQSDTSVLILGESGVGKELVANAIHMYSERAAKPFIKVNCAALPETLLESELFGHERGSFTGAVQQKKGRFELAHGGTLFLDEVGDFSPSTQVKLLRVLQEKQFERLGGTQSLRTDVRIIAATNRNLEELIAAGTFRQDLYYRLNVFPILVPPLRERKTDILLLADYFIEKYNKALKRDVRRISTPAIDMLMSYHWPGNVRELENCIERAVLLSKDKVIHSHQLPPSLQTAETSNTRPSRGTLAAAIAAVEREMIQDALKAAAGNMAKAARDLSLSERIMGLRVKKYGINPKRFR